METHRSAAACTWCGLEKVRDSAGLSTVHVPDRAFHSPWKRPEAWYTLRASQFVAGHADLQYGLITGLNESLDQIKQNWESANAVLILAAIAARLVSPLCPSPEICRECLSFLERCRNVASAWLLALRGKMQEAMIGTDRSDFMTKSIEIACICMLTFDLDANELREVLTSREQASLFGQCAIILSELDGGVSQSTSSVVGMLKLRFQRTMYRSHSILANKQMALDDAVGNSWGAYRAGTARWTRTSSSWITKQVTLAGGDEMSVYLDLLTGELRVNGERLKRTPKAYEAHPLYTTLFGRVGVEVLESRVPGMRFSAKKEYEGFGVHLNLKGGCELTIQARSDSSTYETLPEALFKGIFPDAFVQDYVHWYNQANGSVEFRPKHSPWPTESSDTWILSRYGHNGQWRLLKDGICLLSSTNTTARHIARLLSPLIPSPRIHILLDTFQQRLDIELPSLQLGFYFYRNTTHLLSKEFRSMAVDSDQNLGSLIGFRSKLLLRHIHPSERLALISEGRVLYETYGDHVSVSVERTLVSKVHPIQVDARLGRLVDNGSMQCKLFMAYLHALTSFCLPDPLTRKSGTEQALSILHSAAVRSFDELSEANKNLLVHIARLTPGRTYYPKDDKIMQTITWYPELSFLSQHGWFYKAVKATFAQAKRSRGLHPESSLKLPKLDHVVEDLLHRDAIRSSVFGISDYGAEDHTDRLDIEYTTGDRDQFYSATSNAFRFSFSVAKGLDGLIWKAPTLKQLWKPLEKIPVVPGLHGDQDMMRYDTSLLAASEVSATQHFMLLHSTIAQAHAEDKPFDRYGLMVWLATMGFSPNASLSVLQTALLLYTAPALRRVRVPDVEYCSPPDDRTCKTDAARDALKELVMEATVSYEESPDYPSKFLPKETLQTARSRTTRDYEAKKNQMVIRFVAALRKQWPVKEPAAPQPGEYGPAWSVNYIDTEKAMNLVKPKFQTWWNN